MASRVKIAAICAVLGTVLGVVAAPAAAEVPTVGAPGIGDPYYPLDGNGGYDIRHYDIRLSYQPSTDELWGTTTILATTTQELSQFNLDFLLRPSSVLVNNRPARFSSQGDGELVVTPQGAVAKGAQLLVVVSYQDVPSKYQYLGASSWRRIPTGAAAIGEPHATRWWFPGSDHPRDKATFDVSVAVPGGLAAVSNGAYVGAFPQPNGWVRHNWRSRSPQGSYQTAFIVADMEIVSATAPNGMPYVNAYYAALENDASARASVERTPEFVDWLSSRFGPYPFEAMGGTVLPGYGGLEHQTRPTYGDAVFGLGQGTYLVLHELAHQWFGNSVSFLNFRDAWLSEGFATYAECLYSEDIGEGTAAEITQYWYDTRYPPGDPFWTVSVADPGAGNNNFHTAVYRRGAMGLQALRTTIGDETFFALMKEWPTRKKHGNATTSEFEALAEELSGQDLSGLFHTWLHATERPAVGPNGTAAAHSSAAPEAIARMKQPTT